MDDDIKKELVSLGHSRWSERDQEAVLTAVSEIERLENEVKRLRAEVDVTSHLLDRYSTALDDIICLTQDRQVLDCIKEARRG
jgi:archaellum component FlaC